MNEEKLGLTANIIQVFGLGLALMVAFQLMNIVDQMLYWLSVTALASAFLAGVVLSNRESKLTHALWLMALSFTLIVVGYAIVVIGVRT